MDESDFMQIVRDQFTSMDTDSDGRLSKEEVHRFERDMAHGLGKTYSYAETDQKFLNIDTDRSGTICKQEFVAYCRKEAGFEE